MKHFTARRNPGLVKAFLSTALILTTEAKEGKVIGPDGETYDIQADCEALRLLAPIRCLISFQTYSDCRIAVVHVAEKDTTE